LKITGQPPTRDEWLTQRRLGIGASDTPSILGLSSWGSAYSVWAEKTGLVEPEDLSDCEWIEMGNVLERPIFELWKERTGSRGEMWAQNESIKHQHHDWMRCTPDATAYFLHERRQNVQIKNVGAHKTKEWADGVPLIYQVQVQHEMAVLGPACLETIVVVLIGGQKLKWFTVERNDRFIESLIVKLAEFWDLVESKTPPPIDGSEATLETINRLHPDDDGTVVDLSNGTPLDLNPAADLTMGIAAAYQEFLENSPYPEDCEAVAADAHYMACKALCKAVIQLETTAKAKILSAIGGSTYATINNNYSLKTQTREKPICPHCGERTGPPSTFRVLRSGVKIPADAVYVDPERKEESSE
jgi:putative phage-type endonuclease